MRMGVCVCVSLVFIPVKNLIFLKFSQKEMHLFVSFFKFFPHRMLLCETFGCVPVLNADVQIPLLEAQLRRHLPSRRP